MKSLSKLLKEWESEKDKTRFGQFFCNNFIYHPWPDCYYADHPVAVKLVRQWLLDNDYFYDPPARIAR